MALAVDDPDVIFPDENGVELHLRSATLGDVDRWLRTWWPELDQAKEWSATWDWAAAVRAASTEGHTCLAISRPDKLDGLVSLSVTDSELSRLEPGRPIVYIDWIDSAPHNRKRFGRQEVKNVTRLLLGVAIDISRQLGFGGRIGLHSGPLVETYYRDHLGMAPGEREEHEDGKWLYFEGSPDWADWFWPEGIEESDS